MLAMNAYRDRGRASRDRPPRHGAAGDRARRVRQGRRRVRHRAAQGPRADGLRRRRRRHGAPRSTSAPSSSSARRPPSRTGSSTRSRSLARSRASAASGFHTDACLGGFVLPWAERLGYDVPPFDFRLPGVTSMSRRHAQVRLRGQGHVRRALPRRGAAPPPVLHGHRLAGRAVRVADVRRLAAPAALSAACWAAMVSIGEAGYLDATRRILETAAQMKDGDPRDPGAASCSATRSSCIAFRTTENGSTSTA